MRIAGVFSFIQVSYLTVKKLLDVDVMLFLRVFTSSNKRKKIEGKVQNGLFLQSDIFLIRFSEIV